MCIDTVGLEVEREKERGIDLWEGRNAIKLIKNEKAEGIDNVVSEMMKSEGEIANEWILKARKIVKSLITGRRQ